MPIYKKLTQLNLNFHEQYEDSNFIMKVAVLIINMGGPDSLDSVEPFLYEIFKDPALISLPLPKLIRNILAKLIIKRRLPKTREIYQKLGGKSPLLDITIKQSQLLENPLNNAHPDKFRVFPAMSYWHPFIEEVWTQVMSDGFDRVVFLSLFPFYSTTTTGAIKNKVYRLLQKYHVSEEKIVFIDRFGTHPLFIRAMKEHLLLHISSSKPLEPVHILFSAHSIPLHHLKKGDPYLNEIKEAVNLIQKELPEKKVKIHLAFQSKIGPIKWLTPSTPEKIEELALKGVKKLYVYPLGFVADNSETIYEIGILYNALANQKGIKDFVCINALNTHPTFIQALKEIVLENYTQKWE